MHDGTHGECVRRGEKFRPNVWVFYLTRRCASFERHWFSRFWLMIRALPHSVMTNLCAVCNGCIYKKGVTNDKYSNSVGAAAASNRAE
jgi:hypothetical protein